MASGFDPNWIESPQQWDTVTLQGVDLPGIAKVTGKLGRKIDVNSPPGADGATLRDKGYDPARISVTLRMWTPEQFNSWEQTNLSLVAIRQQSQRTALEIVHPALNNLGVRRVYLETIGVLHEGGTRGVYETELTFIQFLPPTQRPTAAVQAQNNNSSLGNQRSAFDSPTSAANTPSTNGAAAPSSNFTPAGGR